MAQAETPVAGQTCLFHVMNASEGAPLSFLSAINDVSNKVVIRLAGGCANLSPEVVAQIEPYFLDAMRGFKGVLFSGGTAHYNEQNKRDIMITGVPVAISESNAGVKVLGSFPRTDIMRFQGGADNLHLDASGNRPDARYDEIVAVQGGVNSLLDWDGDLNLYFNLMEIWRSAGAKTAVITFNGGGVTYKEGVRALEEGHKLIVIKGSGRRSEDLATEFANHPNCFVADINDPNSLRTGLLKFGLLPNNRR